MATLPEGESLLERSPSRAAVVLIGGLQSYLLSSSSAAHLTNLVRMTVRAFRSSLRGCLGCVRSLVTDLASLWRLVPQVHSTVTRELSASMTSLVVQALKSKDGQPIEASVVGAPLVSVEGASSPIATVVANQAGEARGISSENDSRDVLAVFVKKGQALPTYRSDPADNGDRPTIMPYPRPRSTDPAPSRDVAVTVMRSPESRPHLPSPGLTSAEYTHAHTRLATYPSATIGPYHSIGPCALPTTGSLPSTVRHSRSTSAATLVASPSLPTFTSPTAPSPTDRVFRPGHRSSSSLGIIGDGRPVRPTTISNHARARTDNSSLASAAARASAMVDRQSGPPLAASTSNPAGPSNTFMHQHWDLVSPAESAATPGPLGEIFGEGSFAYPSPSVVSTPSSACVSLTEEDEHGRSDEDHGRGRLLSFASESIESDADGRWDADVHSFGGGGRATALGFSGGFDRTTRASSFWDHSTKRGQVWGVGQEQISGRSSAHLSARSSDSSLSSTASFLDVRNAVIPATPSPVGEEEVYPTPTPTYASFPTYTPPRHEHESRRPSLPNTPGPFNSAFGTVHSGTHQGRHLLGPDLPMIAPVTLPAADERARPTASLASDPSSRPPADLGRTPRPQPRGTMLPPPPSSLLPREMRERPPLPFYPVIDTRGTRTPWVSSGGGF